MEINKLFYLITQNVTYLSCLIVLEVKGNEVHFINVGRGLMYDVRVCTVLSCAPVVCIYCLAVCVCVCVCV